MGFFNLEHFEANMKPILDRFTENDNYLKDKWKEAQRLNHEVELLKKEDISILSELKQHAIFSRDFLAKLSSLLYDKSITSKEKEERRALLDLLITTFFSEVGLSEEEVAEIKVAACTIVASDIGPCCYYIEFDVPCFSSKDKIIVSIPLYEISLQATESYTYKIGTVEGSTIKFAGQSVYLSEILEVLERTFAPIHGDTDGDHVER